MPTKTGEMKEIQKTRKDLDWMEQSKRTSFLSKNLLISQRLPGLPPLIYQNMKLSPLIVLLLAAYCGDVAAKCQQKKLADKNPPNIVFVMADDYGFHDIGYHGSFIQTPTLDKLAASGVKLENYYVQPICSPTRAQFMTGQHVINLGLQYSVITSCQPLGLPKNVTTLADKLREAGYSTHLVGKWHLGYYEEGYLPQNRGFDTFYGFLNGQRDHFSHTLPFKGKQYLNLRDNNGPIRTESGHYSTHLFTEKAKDIIRSHDHNKPLFLYLAYQSPHNPLQVPPEYTTQYENIQNINRRNYAAMISALDQGIANLTQTLKSEGLWDNTVFVFSTDNGGKPSYAGNNYPLRGEKFTYWEGGVRGVAFVTGGNRTGLPNGLVNKELIDVTDWFPTFIRVAGGNLNGTSQLHGVDQWDTLRTEVPSQRQVLLHNIDTKTPKFGNRLYNDTFDNRIYAGIRVGDYKLLTGKHGAGQRIWPPEENVTDDFPTFTYSSSKNLWLFNITADPTEDHDLSDEKPDVVKELLDLLQKYSETALKPQYPASNYQLCDPSKHGGVWGPWNEGQTVVG